MLKVIGFKIQNITRFYSTTTSGFDILFFGTDSFSLPCLKALHKSEIVNKLDVVTPPDAISGRGKKSLKPTLVKEYCLQNNLKVYDPNLKAIKLFQPDRTYDLAVVVSYGAFLPKTLLNNFKLGGINVHPSLLPKYRGPAPLLNTLWNQDEICGITVQQLSTKAFDAGSILKQQTYPVQDKMYLEFHSRMADLGSKLLIETLMDFESLNNNRFDQDTTQVTKAPKLDKSLATINWTEDTLHTIIKKFNVLGWKFPIVTSFDNIPIQLFNLNPYIITPSETFDKLEVGKPIWYQNKLLIPAMDSVTTNCFLQVGSLKLKDRKLLDAKQFYLSYIKDKPKPSFF